MLNISWSEQESAATCCRAGRQYNENSTQDTQFSKGMRTRKSERELRSKRVGVHIISLPRTHKYYDAITTNRTDIEPGTQDTMAPYIINGKKEYSPSSSVNTINNKDHHYSSTYIFDNSNKYRQHHDLASTTTNMADCYQHPQRFWVDYCIEAMSKDHARVSSTTMMFVCSINAI